MTFKIKSVWIIPSFYGLIAWTVALTLLTLDIVKVYPISILGKLIFFYIFLTYLGSSLLFYSKANSIFIRNHPIKVYPIDWGILWASTLVGMAGLFKYILDLSDSFGGIQNFFIILFISSLDIRQAASETASIGFQLSYFSWISILFGIYLFAVSNIHRWSRYILIAIVFIEILLNLSFVDRTRPVWLLLVCTFGWYFSGRLDQANILKMLIYIGVMPLIIFSVFAFLVGKYNDDWGIFGTLVAYVVGGFGYLDSLITTDVPYDYFPIRTFYPVAKALASVGFIAQVPSQVLVDRSIPFDTNVGTFIEPLFSDGGLLYTILGVPILIFLIDYIALIAFKVRTIFGLFLWANLVFCSLISFFVPKFNSVPIYLFSTIFFILNVATRYGRNTPLKS